MLTFNEKEHQYYINDKLAISATQLLELIYPFDKTNLNQNVLENAMARGSYIHSCIEQYIELGVDTCNQHREYFDAFIEWYKSSIVAGDKLYSEKQMYSESYMVAGTTDLIIVNDNTKTITFIDFKTNTNIVPKKVALQLSIYKILYAPQNGYNVVLKALQLTKEGVYKEYDLTTYMQEAETIAIGLMTANIYKQQRATQHTIKKGAKEYESNDLW